MSLGALERANPLDAGLDLRATEGGALYHGRVTAVKTGVTADIPPGHVGLVMGRSSLARKGVGVLGGVIDSGYTGEIIVLLTLHQHGTLPFDEGDKIAQLVVVPLSFYIPGAVSERGARGFGSTGR